MCYNWYEKEKPKYSCAIFLAIFKLKDPLNFLSLAHFKEGRNKTKIMTFYFILVDVYFKYFLSHEVFKCV